MNGIGEEWSPIPARFGAEVLTARYSVERPAPERDGWLWCWTLAKEGKPPSIRSMMDWTGWKSTKTRRVHAEACSAFKQWATPAAKIRKATTQGNGQSQHTQPTANAESEAESRPSATQARGHPQHDRARVLSSTLTETVATGTPPAHAGGPHWPAVVHKTKPRKEPSGNYHAAIAAWDAEHLSAFGVSYPWVFVGRDADGARIKAWLSTARVTEADPAPGLGRLRTSFAAYFAAVQTQEAWPRGDPASTRHYTRDIAKWLQVDPMKPTRPPPERQSNASRELARLYREADEEEQRGIPQDDHPSNPSPPGVRLLQRPSGG